MSWNNHQNNIENDYYEQLQEAEMAEVETRFGIYNEFLWTISKRLAAEFGLDKYEIYGSLIQLEGQMSKNRNECLSVVSDKKNHNNNNNDNNNNASTSGYNGNNNRSVASTNSRNTYPGNGNNSVGGRRRVRRTHKARKSHRKSRRSNRK